MRMGNYADKSQFDDFEKKYLAIFKKFARDFLDYENDPDSNLLWPLLVNIQPTLIRQVNYLMRKLGWFYYKLDKLELLSEINNTFLKMNHIFARPVYQQEVDAKEGIKIFQRLIQSSFSGEELQVYLANLIKINNFFTNEDYYFLIQIKEEISKIKLPERDYELLKARYNEILNLLANPDKIIFSEISADLLKEKYLIFIFYYRKIYRVEHENYQKNIKFFLQQLKNLPEYKLFERLKHINSPVKIEDIIPFNHYLNSFFPHKCEKLEPELDPIDGDRCECGFKLGEKCVNPELEKIKPMLVKGISEYISYLQNDHFINQRLKPYLVGREQSVLNNIDEIKSFADIDDIFSDEIINELNQVIEHTDNEIITIYLKEIVDSISGKYTFAEKNVIKERFNLLLGQALDEHQFDAEINSLIKFRN